MIQTGTALQHKASGVIAKYLAGIVTQAHGILHVIITDVGYIFRLGDDLLNEFNVELAHPQPPAPPVAPSVATLPVGPQFAGGIAVEQAPAPGTFASASVAPAPAPVPQPTAHFDPNAVGIGVEPPQPVPAAPAPVAPAPAPAPAPGPVAGLAY